MCNVKKNVFMQYMNKYKVRVQNDNRIHLSNIFYSVVTVTDVRGVVCFFSLSFYNFLMLRSAAALFILDLQNRTNERE